MNSAFVLHEPQLLMLTIVGSALLCILLERRRARDAISASESVSATLSGIGAATIPPFSAEHQSSTPRGLFAVGIAATALLLALVGSSTAWFLIWLLACASLWLVCGAAYANLGVLGERQRRRCVLVRFAALLVLLLLLAQPGCHWTRVTWQRPLVALLLDQSRSMALEDFPSRGLSRAARANRVLETLRSHATEMEASFEIQVQGFADRSAPLSDWRIDPQGPLSALAAALRGAARARSSSGDPPIAVVLVSDGAENAADALVVQQAAEELKGQRTALLAVGVGPQAGHGPGVVLDAIEIPARIATRDRLTVPVAGRVLGCAATQIHVAVRWDAEPAAEKDIEIDSDDARLATELVAVPPGPGLRRLHVVVTLPADRGGEAFEQSAVVDVRDDRIRVLFVDRQPRSETAFAARALRTDPQFEVATRILARDADSEDAPIWRDFDVVVLGSVARETLSDDALSALAAAVREHAIGLMLLGGEDLLHEPGFAATELNEVSPVELGSSAEGAAGAAHVAPTSDALARTILGDPAHPDAVERWSALPAIPRVAMGKRKPLAIDVALDDQSEALLVAMEVGRGRSLAAAWESSWPWALASDEGLALHRRFWRQGMRWLANRKPSAWLLTDQTEYPQALIESSQRRIMIRAGVSPPQSTDARRVASLELRRRASDATSAPTDDSDKLERHALVLARDGDNWRAEIGPADFGAALEPGNYELEFRVGALDGAADREPLVARSAFAINSADIETRRPTSNLALLRDAAERTAALGGVYCEVEDMLATLRALSVKDRRVRVEIPVSANWARDADWLWLLLLTAALAIEWSIRKQNGLR